MKTESRIEVDNDCFEGRENGQFNTVLLVTKIEKHVGKRTFERRKRDTVLITGDSRDACDEQVAKFCARPDVTFLEPAHLKQLNDKP